MSVEGKKKLMRGARAVAAEGVPHVQYGALCYRMQDGRPEILLITSRDSGRWVIPKGWPIPGLSPAASAAREAFEEAGVEGQPATASLGHYDYLKTMPQKKALPCRVDVFPVAVERLAARFPEKGQRRLRWFRPGKAATRVAEPGLRELLATFDPGTEGAGPAGTA